MKLKSLIAFGIASLLISTSVPSIAAAATEAQMVQTAKKYIGTPYRYGGTTTSGIDCSAYTQVVFKNSGESLPRTTGQQFQQGKSVAKSNLQTGDLVFFNTSGRGVSHVGIYIGSNNFIHASTSQGVMISSLNDPYYWKSRYVGAKRTATFGSTTVAAKPKPAPIRYASRGEIANVVVKSLGLHRTYKEADFPDVSPKTSYYNEIMAAAEAGIFRGNSSGRFNPTSSLTRSQMALVLTKSFDLSNTTTASSSKMPFKDVPKGYYAADAIGAMYANKVTVGYTNGNFGVDDKVKIQDMQRFINNLK